MLRNYFYSLIGKHLRFYCNDYGNVASVKDIDSERASFFGLNLNQKMWTSNSQNISRVISEGDVHFQDCLIDYFKNLHIKMNHESRLIITYYSNLWKIPLILASLLGFRKNTPEQNWVTPEDIANLLYLSDFQVISEEKRIIIPFNIPYISDFINRFIAPLFPFNHLCLMNIAVARPLHSNSDLKSVSVVVAARNEAGNLEDLIQRTPLMGNDELIIIEGNSTDNTWEVLQDLIKKFPDKNIKIAQQDGVGKGDAVRKGFAMASKDILMILDADMTVPPEDLPKFYEAIKSGKGEFINGSRLVYPMEGNAMRFFNLLGNKFFAMAFSYVLKQNLKDTLCGTKVISKKNYELLIKNRLYFGNFDPFGDFDLIFGASKMSLKIVEIPIKYRDRLYGETNISRWKHGWLLLKMLKFSAGKIKFL